MRKTKQKLLYTRNTFFHIYNRGNRKEKIFWNYNDYIRFLKALRKYEKLFDLILYGFCLMPNHYHLLIKTGIDENSITKYMHRSMTSYSMYFNKKYSLVGRLFQGVFQAKRLDSVPDIIKAVKYLERNPVKAGLVKNASDYKWLTITLQSEEEKIYLETR